MDSYITTERLILKNKYTRTLPTGKTKIVERKLLKICRKTCTNLSTYGLLAQF